MGGHEFLYGLAAFSAALWFAGMRALQHSGGKREKAVYTLLLIWCVYILLSQHYETPPITVANVNKAFMPLGHWVEMMVLGKQE